MNQYLSPVLDLLNYQLFHLGQAQITPLNLLYLLALSIVLIYLSGRLKNRVVLKLLERTPLKFGARQAVGTIVRYLILLIGFIVILQAVGIDLTAFSVLAGAVGIGIGLGLQGIANNFISGLLILLERPIQVSDRIEIGGVTGEVVAIGARSTRIRTNDNISIIVPNSRLVSENVVNLSYENETVRIKVPIMVSHEADTRLVEKLMMEAAAENSDIVETPEPAVRFVKMDHEGLYFQLRVWSRLKQYKPTTIKSDLTFAIVDRLRANGIRLSRNEPLPEPKRPEAVTNGDLRDGTTEKATA